MEKLSPTPASEAKAGEEGNEEASKEEVEEKEEYEWGRNRPPSTRSLMTLEAAAAAAAALSFGLGGGEGGAKLAAESF